MSDSIVDESKDVCYLPSEESQRRSKRERERAKYGERVHVYKLTPVRLYVLSVCALNLRTSVDEILCLCVKVGTYLYVATTKRTLGERVCIFACV